MFVLVVYDVPAERTRIYRKLLRRRLEHVQYSVFYGDISLGQLADIKHDVTQALEPNDSILIFEAEASSAVSYTTYGDSTEPGSRFT